MRSLNRIPVQDITINVSTMVFFSPIFYYGLLAILWPQCRNLLPSVLPQPRLTSFLVQHHIFFPFSWAMY